MKAKLILSIVLLSFIFQVHAGMQKASEGGFEYEYVENDPLNARIYTLENGLKVYLSVYKDEPRVQTYIACRTGSRNDPADATGLAHYLEHMLFKGTDKMATSNWEKEQELIQQISDLYEKRRKTKNEEKRKELYEQIDKLSYEASKYAVPNEYDKMISSLGAKGTNAYTSVDQTVYVNNIPSNELEKWLMVEGERFSKLVLRLFHTELEAVYEEYNISQDRDGMKVFKALMSDLYPNHPYGTQTTIGEGEHLKNPSMEKIHEYFNSYYVPNNMAVVISGDLDYTETVKMVDKYFGDMEPGKVPKFKKRKNKAVEGPIVKEVKGQEAAWVELAWKFEGANTKESMMVQMVDGILANGQAGLIDLNLVQGQKVLDASSGYWDKNDYTTHFMDATPKEGQTLDEAKDLLLAELDKVKKGEFDEWLLDAIIKDFKYSEIKAFESNRGRANAMLGSFIESNDWDYFIDRFNRMSKVTKDDVVKFANKHYGDNYVLVYKQQAEDESVAKVEKPEITPIETNRDNQSDFYKTFAGKESSRIQPAFLDYDGAISTSKVKKSKLPLSYLKNELNETFALYYILDMGSDHDKMMSLAIDYLPYLGTDKYTAEELQKEFFRLGLSFDVSSSADKIFVQLSGLEESLEEGVDLFEHILANVKADKGAYQSMVQGVIKSREDAKSNKRAILWSGLRNYAIYGKNSPFLNRYSAEELQAINPEDLVNKVKSITSYKHRIFYYGTKNIKDVSKLLKKKHKVNKRLKDYPKRTEYARLSTNKDKVYFVNVPDMVQAQILMVSREKEYDSELESKARLFNEYFGSGLSSIVFQEIRESKALAYSAFSSFTTPSEEGDPHYTYAFVGTQGDKMKDAIKAMSDLMDNMPVADAQIDAARNAVLKKIETERITKSNVFWNYERAKKKGLDYDIRKDVYNKVKSMSSDELETFFKENISGNNYNIMIMSSKEALDMDFIKSLGEYEELSLEDLFGF